MQNLMIEARDLMKNFGDFQALKGVSFSMPKGCCFGLLGPNGAGKSTTLKLITTFLTPSSGSLTVLGLDPKTQSRELKARLGVVHQEDNLDSDLPVLENLLVYGSYFGLSKKVALDRAMELLSFAQLQEKKNEKIKNLSGGMRRRLMIARGLINNPELLILDEPTTGLDPQARHLIWDRLTGLKQKGVSLVLCTHYMEEASRLCDQLIMMDEGKIVAQGTPTDLTKEVAGERVVELPGHLEPALKSLLAKHSPEGFHLEASFSSFHLFFHNAQHPAYAEVRSTFESEGLFRQPNLEDVFLLLTGRDLVD